MFVSTAEEYGAVGIEMSLWCAVLFQVVQCCRHGNVTVVCCVVSGVLKTAFVSTAEEYDTVGIEMSLWCAVLFQVF